MPRSGDVAPGSGCTVCDERACMCPMPGCCTHAHASSRKDHRQHVSPSHDALFARPPEMTCALIEVQPCHIRITTQHESSEIHPDKYRT